AATATNTPDLDSAVTALFSAVDFDPPRERFATDFAAWCAFTQLTPAITSEVVPEPSQPSTCTACSRTLLATPYDFEPMIPATCVPWPLQSAERPYTVFARPPNWVSDVAMPVSITYASTPDPVCL